MKKSVIHAIVDSISLIAAALLLVTGSVLAFVLPHRSGRVGLSWMDISRHSWSDLHYYFSLVFCVLIVIHIVSHWSFIKALAWGTAQNPRPMLVRISVALISLLLALLVIMPFLIPTQKDGVVRSHRARSAAEVR